MPNVASPKKQHTNDAIDALSGERPKFGKTSCCSETPSATHHKNKLVRLRPRLGQAQVRKSHDILNTTLCVVANGCLFRSAGTHPAGNATAIQRSDHRGTRSATKPRDTGNPVVGLRHPGNRQPRNIQRQQKALSRLVIGSWSQRTETLEHCSGYMWENTSQHEFMTAQVVNFLHSLLHQSVKLR